MIPSVGRESTNVRLGTLWLRDSHGAQWERVGSASTVEVRRDQTLVAREVDVSARLTLRLKKAMADEEVVRIELAPPASTREGQVRAIYFDERSGHTTVTIGELAR